MDVPVIPSPPILTYHSSLRLEASPTWLLHPLHHRFCCKLMSSASCRPGGSPNMVLPQAALAWFHWPRNVHCSQWLLACVHHRARWQQFQPPSGSHWCREREFETSNTLGYSSTQFNRPIAFATCSSPQSDTQVSPPRGGQTPTASPSLHQQLMVNGTGYLSEETLS
jgi:hypothetical protein